MTSRLLWQIPGLISKCVVNVDDLQASWDSGCRGMCSRCCRRVRLRAEADLEQFSAEIHIATSEAERCRGLKTWMKADGFPDC